MRKFATGGFMNFFKATPNPAKATNTVTDGGSSGGSSSSKGSSTTDGLLSKEVENAIFKEGLPSDVKTFFNNLQNFERASDFGMGVDKNQLYALKAQANDIIRSAKQVDKAQENMLKNNAQDSIAVDSRGNIFVLGENGISQQHLSQFDPNSGRALTTSEILDLRINHPSMAFNNTMLKAVNNSVGMEVIQKYLRDIISTIGKSTNTREAYQDLASLVGQEAAKQPTQQQQETIQKLYNLMEQIGPDAIFKIQDSIEQQPLLDAYNYISQVLPQKMQTQLLANYVGYGQGSLEDASNNNYIAGIIQNALSTSNTSKVSHSMNFDAQINKGAGTKVGKALESQETTKTRPETGVEMFFNSHLNRQDIIISDPNNKNQVGIEAPGNTMASLMVDGGQAIGVAPLKEALIAGGKGMGKYLDFNHAFAGYDKLTGVGDLNKFMYKGDEIANVWMPVTSLGDIDWQAVQCFADAEEQIKLNHITDIEEKNRIHRAAGSKIQYDSEGRVLGTPDVAQFLMLNTYTIDDNLSDDNLMYYELDGDAETSADELIKETYDKYKISMPNKNYWDDIIQVPMFFKIQPNAGLNAAYYARHGSEVPKNTLQDDMIRQELSQPTQPIYGAASALYQE